MADAVSRADPRNKIGHPAHDHKRFMQDFVVKETWCLTSTETIRLSRDGEKGVRGNGGGGGGEEGDNIPIATMSWFLH